MFKNILVHRDSFLELIRALPVTTEVGGASQLNKTLVLSLLQTKLEGEMDGPREGSIVSMRQITRRNEGRRDTYNRTGEHCLKGHSNVRYYLAPSEAPLCAYTLVMQEAEGSRIHKAFKDNTNVP